MADNRIAYGLAKKYGIDTKGMSPKEVWDALKGHGVTQQNAQEKYSSDGNGGTHEPTEAESKRLKDLGIEKEVVLSEDDRKTTKEFVVALNSAKSTVSPENAWRVSSPLEEEFDEEHPNARKYVTKGGSTVAITSDGDIVGVCHRIGDPVSGSDMLLFAVKNGGKKLDAFSKLWRFYSRNGFEPVSWTPFNEEYAPSDWSAARDEKEPIIFWKYTGKHTSYKNSDEFLSSVAASESYDEAKKKRDDEVEA